MHVQDMLCKLLFAQILQMMSQWILLYFCMLVALRNSDIPMLALREKSWRGSTLPADAHDYKGKVFGILGMGGIGRSIMRKASAPGMTVILLYVQSRLGNVLKSPSVLY